MDVLNFASFDSLVKLRNFTHFSDFSRIEPKLEVFRNIRMLEL